MQAVSIIGSAADLFLTGIGASWNAVLAAGSLFYSHGRAVHMQEAGELLHFTAIPRGAVIIAISRTGRSIEIVQLLAKAKASGAAIIGVTNCTDSPLTQASAVVIVVPTKLDHGISVNTYSSLLIASGVLASSTTTGFASIASQLSESVAEAGQPVLLAGTGGGVELARHWRTLLFPRPRRQFGNLPGSAIALGGRRKNFRDRHEHERRSARSAANRRGGCALLYVDRSGADARSGFVHGSRSEEARCIGDAHRREPSARCRRLGVPVAHFSSSLAMCN